MASLSEYQGKPVLVLNLENKYPFSFGYAKAKLIVDNLETIKLFVQACEAKGHAPVKDTTEEKAAALAAFLKG